MNRPGIRLRNSEFKNESIEVKTDVIAIYAARHPQPVPPSNSNVRMLSRHVCNRKLVVRYSTVLRAPLHFLGLFARDAR